MQSSERLGKGSRKVVKGNGTVVERGLTTCYGVVVQASLVHVAHMDYRPTRRP